MPTIPLHPRPLTTTTPVENPLPQLLHTPSGLAILELQGNFQYPPPAPNTSSTQLGKLVFPLYNPDLNDPSDTKWMKRVYMYVGKGQRLTGECKKLGKPLAVVRKRASASASGEGEDVDMGGVQSEELEIVEVIKYKIVFSSRPEPVSGVDGE